MSIDLWDKLPSFFILAVTLWIYLLIETFLNQQKPWFFPALAVYFTIGMWYFTEIIYTPEGYLSMPPDIVQYGFIQIIIFLISYRLFLPYFVKKLTPRTFNTLPQFSLIAIRSEQILYILSLIWFLILIWGLNRVNWNIIGVMFPLNARAGSIGMFSRGAIGGASDFLVSFLGYTYLLICSFFGVLLFFHKRRIVIVMNIGLICLTWPMFLFSGTRNALLAVLVPCFLTYLIISKQEIWIKMLIAATLFIGINYVMSVIIAFRNVGFYQYFDQVSKVGLLRAIPENQKQEGLNMAYELFSINNYLSKGVLSIKYGYDYLVEIFNIIPRALWPDKPTIGFDYAQLRAPNQNDTGFAATVSRGLIGGGVMNFGPVFGPVAPALLMAIWSGVLARFWQQRYSLLRFALFLVGLGITPNLGRDFTLLVLWPVIFGYLLVLWIERREQKKRRLTTS